MRLFRHQVFLDSVLYRGLDLRAARILHRWTIDDGMRRMQNTPNDRHDHAPCAPNHSYNNITTIYASTLCATIGHHNLQAYIMTEMRKITIRRGMHAAEN